ncbi:phytanoyl-CoA dioxygenase family protein [Vibrio nitrifigilis]|uniref:Phytanoyl-CoA dioxygenase family protein n=1 Tax=Vibrio nitrifigilis TaxID=2789781 RepID=A0ABS0GJ25_9VIBR|nr:phytanoyl-CoA dioxygenase family protein [Vibrio nitrifigilis]MBF9002330.1 phytanoyl-CoA dioxygenase family protein [Vibrio nitrifigilis]
MIEQSQVEQYQKNGFLVVENVLTPEEIASLQQDFDQWVQDSRQHEQPWGETLDGRARFDIESDHSAEHPSLRRVTSPTDISDAYRNMALTSKVAKIAGQLVGSQGARLHHSKINSKLPHTATEVKWHQDFPFTPHSNDDLVTCLIMISDVTAENGPLQVIPGSHKGPLFSHWNDDQFTGVISDDVEKEHCQNPISCAGVSGSVCFMHTRLLHASSPNNTDDPRTLYICVYAAEDALPLCENPLPSQHAGTLVAGSSSGKIRCTENELRLPQKPKGASFFEQQAGTDTVSA